MVLQVFYSQGDTLEATLKGDRTDFLKIMQNFTIFNGI